ncbi:di-N-acetylchitobiase [Notechis scutatus]|uniref:Di-N-acetylchitobiase n=1 Tax=Notechis scutatus TaxID=8663 RepID=A0A6J1UTA9_9SAUR|nr:di-N-acetylchitobiase [Notechis scutatus]
MKRLLGGGGALPCLALLLRHWLLGSSACPCEQPALCKPISSQRDFEVFVFDVGGKTWKFYDWTQITTVATFGDHDPELICYAHSKRSRVVLKGNISVKKILKPAVRIAWIKQNIGLAKKQYMDGINIDIEQTVKKSSAEYYALTALVKETTEVFHKEIPGSQVTFDVPWSPECIDGRCYNYTGIADSCDFLFVMSYDEQSPLWSNCIAGANAPYKQTLLGYYQYIRMGINPKKLVMGVPWFGYDYICSNLHKDHVCFLAKKVFPGALCNNVIRQTPYRIIMTLEKTSTSGILWDEEQKAPFLEYKDSNGAFHQLWFDNAKSISLKAAYAKERGLRGIGMWNANCLDYSASIAAQQQREAMWKALKGAKFMQEPDLNSDNRITDCKIKTTKHTAYVPQKRIPCSSIAVQ